MSLILDDLTFSYGRRAVLQGVDATWETGQTVGLLGPNGAGKSTLVTCVAQLRRHLGEVTFAGRRGHDLRGMIGYMPQGRPGDAALTALESVLTASRRGMTWHTSRADIDLAWSALDELGVAEPTILFRDGNVQLADAVREEPVRVVIERMSEEIQKDVEMMGTLRVAGIRPGTEVDAEVGGLGVRLSAEGHPGCEIDREASTHLFVTRV